MIDLAPADITAFFDAADPRALAVTHLGTATTRIIYDLERVPVCAASIARETHVSDLTPGNQTKVQLHFVYSDGFGREAQTKVQAEPGPLDLADPNSQVADPRWVGTGEKVYNNKGKPVRQYEPFFSATPQFSIETWGVSSTLFYDPVERVVATLHPNNTFEKVVFDPWQQTSSRRQRHRDLRSEDRSGRRRLLQPAAGRRLSADLVSAADQRRLWAPTSRARRRRPPRMRTRRPSRISTRLAGRS